PQRRAPTAPVPRWIGQGAAVRSPQPLPEPFAGVPFRVRDARLAGVSGSRLRRGDLSTPFRGVRAIAADDLRSRAAAYAAKMPAHQAFGGATAARLWGLPLPTRWHPSEPLVIARPSGSTRGSAAGTRHIAFDGARLRTTAHRGVRLLTPLSTAVMLARELDHERLVHVVDALLTASRRYPDLALPRRPHMTSEQLESQLARLHGLKGVPSLRAAAADARPGVDSRFESITRRVIVRAGPPEPAVHPLVVVGGVELHPDLGYPELGVAVEYEGEGHLDPERWARDILRYEMLEAAGWIVVRITKADLARGGERCAARVRAALRRRA
ncbi:endonuclease domain-containing protein, partial [Agrococcus sp. HG114]|uniref:endonuclease domain-containing protein n=1 Tax=Agrococcus sp. HG114 TaxID=2969757 RepID=UPI00215A7CE1